MSQPRTANRGVFLGHDARIRETEDNPFGRLLAEEELAADKLLALMSRAAPRDFVDVAALAGRVGFARLRELGAEKDRGFDGRMLLFALESMDRLARSDFPVSDEEFTVLGVTVRGWVLDVRAGLGLTRGTPDPGLGL